MVQAEDMVGAKIVDDDGTPVMVPSKSPSPILIFDKSPEGMAKNERRFVSLTQFLSFDVAAAKKAGGTFQNVLNTVKRTPDPGAKQEALSLAKLGAVLKQINALLDQENIEQAIMREANKAAGGDQFAYDMVECFLLLQRVEPALREKHGVVVAQIKADQDKARTEKAARLAARHNAGVA
jgi:hypothetical protein